MSSKYRFEDREGLYFVTPTLAHWKDVFCLIKLKKLCCFLYTYIKNCAK